MDITPVRPKLYRLTMFFSLEDCRNLVKLMDILDGEEFKEIVSEFRLSIQKNSQLCSDLRGA